MVSIPDALFSELLQSYPELWGLEKGYICWKVLDWRALVVNEGLYVYRHYATSYFIFCVDSSKSELGILETQVFVETLDKCFENVCELHLNFHTDAVHRIPSEIEEQNKLVKQEAAISAATARAGMSAAIAVKSTNIPQQIKDINLSDLPQAIKDLKF
uniref:AP complex mu/sigma subunit domain-containing protein n=1 Tax=Glossina pallidipes TaxID=7398 RepID=A0A1A9ZXF2_GLOPL